ncbi:MAG: hypothetical protein ABSG90_14400 [Dehalococcoidia bacterium]|jgi:hypothetical protein
MLSLVKAFISKQSLPLAAICLSVLTFAGQLIITERYKASIKKDNDRFLEELRWEFKTREQAVKVAEYLSLQTNLKEDSPKSEYDLLNRLGWELSFWLPANLYRKLGQAAVSPTLETRRELIIEIRGLLLGEKAGNLTAGDVLYHAPGIGKHRK